MHAAAQSPPDAAPRPAKINTRRVTGRREVHFNHPREIVAEAERLVQGEFRTLGNLTAGEIFMHLARMIDMSIDGLPEKAPWWMRLFAQTFMKNRLLRRTMPPGLSLPENFSRRLLPKGVATEAGLQGLRNAVARLETTDVRHPSPVLGPLTKEQWNELHCRHAELHFSFLVPVERASN